MINDAFASCTRESGAELHEALSNPHDCFPDEIELLNYRHSFHAGNIADVFKHIVLTLVLRALHKKVTPFCVIDTHAGSGLYALKAPGEFEQGVGVIWPERGNWTAFVDYFAVVEKFNGRGGLKHYPGSPFIIAEFLRPQDRAVLMELNEQECRYLKNNMAGIRNAAVQGVDAWKAFKGFVPPKENRGLVLIDPPYEAADDFDNVLAVLRYGAKHWRNGIYMAWYPFKSRKIVARFHEGVRDLGIEAQAVEFMTLPDDVENRLNGSGLVIVNAPWKLMDTLREVLPPLAERLAGASGRPGVRFVDL
jgi:23S rRNA (adenine2030-N6)-methyltransferase